MKTYILLICTFMTLFMLTRAQSGTTCQPGKGLDPDSDTCADCLAGTFSSTYSGATCDSCPRGTWGTATGSSSASVCSACPTGSYSDDAAPTTCTECPVGFFSTTTQAKGIDACLSCPKGSYSNTNGSTECSSDCAEGWNRGWSNLMTDFASFADTMEKFDIYAIQGIPKWQVAPAFDGRYVYYYSEGSGDYCYIGRFDTTGEFTDSQSWALKTITSINGKWPTGFSSITYCNGMVFFAPDVDYNYNDVQIALIYFTDEDFSSDSSYLPVDLGDGTVFYTQSANMKNYKDTLCVGRYLYLVPSSYTDRIFLRLDTTFKRNANSYSAWEYFNWTYEKNWYYFNGMGTDLNYIYFASDTSPSIRRYNMDSSFSSSGSYEEAFWPANPDCPSSISGKPVFDGTFMYFTAFTSGIVRYNVSKPFIADSFECFDHTSLYMAAVKGVPTAYAYVKWATSDSRYLYGVPQGQSSGDTGLMRYDTQMEFTNSSSYEVSIPSKFYDTSFQFTGGSIFGNHMYLTLNSIDEYFGSVLRFPVTNPSPQSTCTACQAGFYSTGVGECDVCAKGQFSTEVGASSSATCQDCGPGKFTSDKGSSACKLCDAGSWTTHSQTSKCEPCYPGFYSTVEGSTSIGNCEPCSAGTFSSKPGQSYCSECSPGTYSSSEESICLSCPAGTWSSITGATSVDECVSCGDYTGSFIGASSAGNCSVVNNHTGCAAVLDGFRALFVNMSRGISSNEFSISLWLKTPIQEIPLSPDDVLFSVGGNNFRLSKLGNEASTQFDLIGNTFNLQAFNIHDGEWHHLVLGWSNSDGGVSVYIDGSVHGARMTSSTPSSTVGLELPSTTFYIQFGSDFGGVNQGVPSEYPSTAFRGTLDDIAFWDHELSPTEAPSIANSKLTGTETGLLYWWNLDDCGFDTICTKCRVRTLTEKINSDDPGIFFSWAEPEKEWTENTGKRMLSDAPMPCSGATELTMSGCTPCLHGNYNDGSFTQCQPCSVGTYSDDYALSFCQNCTSGTYSNITGASSSTYCENCDPGSWSSKEASVECFKCPKGSWSSIEGAKTSEDCLPCPVGYSSNHEGSSGCMPCEAGTWKSNENEIECKKCEKGYWSTQTAATSIEACSKCDAGKYSNFEGSTICEDCNAGTYSDTPGSSDCTKCAGGTWSSQMAGDSADSCIPCPDVHASPEGSTSASACVPKNNNGRCALSLNQSIAMQSMIDVTATGMSVSMWAKISSNSTNVDVPFSYGNEVFELMNTGSTGTCSARIAGAAQFTLENLVIQDNDWHHLIMTWSSSTGTVTIYIDGSMAAAQSISSPMSTLNGVIAENGCFFLGQKPTACSIPDATNGFNAEVDDVAIWDHGLTATEAAEYSRYRLNGTESGLIHLYNFDDCSDSIPCETCDLPTASDSVGSSHGSLILIGYETIVNNRIRSTAPMECPAGQKIHTEKGCTDCDIGTFSNEYSSTCSQCPYGHWTNTTGSITCIPCPVGMYLELEGGISADNCTYCEPGTWTSSTGTEKCNECPAGTWSSDVGADSHAYCIPCAAGWYSTGEAQTTVDACNKCGQGYYSSVEGLDSQNGCQPCPTGSWSSTEGNSDVALCIECDPGFYLDYSPAISESECIPCFPGTYNALPGQEACPNCLQGTWSTQSEATSDTVCQKCESGTWSSVLPSSSADNCIPCSPGTWSSIEGAMSVGNCENCPAGTYSTKTAANDLSSCVFCPEGYYSASEAATGIETCLPCGPGKWSSTQGAPDSIFCNKCGTGTFGTKNAAGSISDCQNCPTGFIANTEGNSECQPCDPGKFQSNEGQDACLDCPSGYKSASSGLSSCEECPVGHFGSADGLSACEECGLGKWNSGIASTFCQSCVEGYYGDTTALSACIPCQMGTYGIYSDAKDASQCVKCNPGRYSVTLGADSVDYCGFCPAGTYSTESGASSLNACHKCPPGHMSTLPGAGSLAQCSECGAGKWSPEGATECNDCPKGTYSTNSAASSEDQCVQCPVGRYGLYESAEDLSDCSTCSAGTWSDALGANSPTVCKQCVEGTYSTLIGAVSANNCSLCPPGTWSDTLGAGSSTTCTKCAKGKWSADTGLTAASDCTDCPMGTWSDEEGISKSSECTLCAAGTYGTSLGSITNEKCYACPAGTYSETLGATVSGTCIDCLEFATSLAGAGAESDCKCRENYFESTDDNNARICSTCPPGAKCEGGSSLPVAYNGWLRTEKAKAEESYVFVQCIPTDACVGGDLNPEGTCAKGYEGNNCGSCSSSYYRLGSKCHECPPNSYIWLVLMAVGVIIFIMIMIKLQQVGVNMATFAIFVSYVQVTTLFSRFDLDWPKQVTDFFNLLSVFNLNIDVASPECTVQMTYVVKFFLKIGLPLIFAVMLMVSVGIFGGVTLFYRYCVKKMRNRKMAKQLENYSGQEIEFNAENDDIPLNEIDRAESLRNSTCESTSDLLSKDITDEPSKPTKARVGWSEESTVAVKNVDKVKRTMHLMGFLGMVTSKSTAEQHSFGMKDLMNYAINAFLTFMAFLYVYVTATALDFFRCQSQPDGTSVLVVESSVVCYTNVWWQVFPYALAAAVVYGAVVPAFILIRLYTLRNRLQERIVRQRYGGLYRKYTARAYYWEVVIMIRKLSVIVVVMFGIDPIIQSAIAILLIFASLLIHTFLRPMAEKRNNFGEFTGLISNFLVLFCGILFFSSKMGAATSEVVTWFAILAIVVTAISFIILVVVDGKALIQAVRHRRNSTINIKKGKGMKNTIEPERKPSTCPAKTTVSDSDLEEMGDISCQKDPERRESSSSSIASNQKKDRSDSIIVNQVQRAITEIRDSNHSMEGSNPGEVKEDRSNSIIAQQVHPAHPAPGIPPEMAERKGSISISPAMRAAIAAQRMRRASNPPSKPPPRVAPPRANSIAFMGALPGQPEVRQNEEEIRSKSALVLSDNE